MRWIVWLLLARATVAIECPHIQNVLDYCVLSHKIQIQNVENYTVAVTVYATVAIHDQPDIYTHRMVIGPSQEESYHLIGDVVVALLSISGPYTGSELPAARPDFRYCTLGRVVKLVCHGQTPGIQHLSPSMKGPFSMDKVIMGLDSDLAKEHGIKIVGDILNWVKGIETLKNWQEVMARAREHQRCKEWGRWVSRPMSLGSWTFDLGWTTLSKKDRPCRPYGKNNIICLRPGECDSERLYGQPGYEGYRVY